MFLAQVSHESAGLTRLEESFNYTKKGLMDTFPSKFKTAEKASQYIKLGPEAIANYVYAFRLGNGSADMGHGWLYRGRGPIQLTGKDNYIAYGKALGLPLELQPDLAATLQHGAAIAARFWQRAGCGRFAEFGDIERCTRVINGGTHGLADRKRLWEQFKVIFQEGE